MQYILILLVSSFLLLLTKLISSRLNLFDVPDNIKIHKERVPNIAGLAFIPFSFFIIFYFQFNEIITKTLFFFTVVVLIGLFDDIKNIKPILKLVVLFLPIYLFTFYVGEVKTLGSYEFFNLNLGGFSLIFTILCIFLLTNAFNYIDGIDGLLALNVLITLIFFQFLTFDDTFIFLSFSIFLLIYFFININFLGIFPKQFIGDAGSLGLGFLISSFLIIYTQIQVFLHPSVIIWLVAFVVYEFLSINIIRIKLKKNIFKRDLNFIFNKLQNKYSYKVSILICTIIHILLCSISILIYFSEFYLFSLILFIILFIIYLILRLNQSLKI
tara:strand:- start:80351 stop:81331 length:981 start_codon:yes stop_codon:yes gene_type:complete